MDTATNLIVLNAIAVWALQWAKSSELVPFLTSETQKANKIASAIISALASAGIVFAFTHTGSVEQGALSISWQGLSVANAVSFIYHTIGNYATQKLIFKVGYSNGNNNAAKKAA